jgi:hypothetical protein
MVTDQKKGGSFMKYHKAPTFFLFGTDLQERAETA